MVAWFVIALATLTVFGFVALNAVENISAATDLAARVETIRRMDAAANALLSMARSPNATSLSYLPAGRVSGSSYILPATLDQYARTGFGQPIVYCPFGGAEAGTDVTISSSNGTNYTVQTASLGGITYVVGGRPAYAQVSANANLIGWLVAPRTRYDPTPSCNSVTYNSSTGKFIAVNAIVRPLIRNIGVEELREAMTREIVWYVSAAGTGRGTSSADPSSLTSALDFWRTRQPYAMRIKFANGNYTFTSGSLNIDSGTFSNLGVNGTLYLEGSPGNVNVSQSAANWVQIPANLDVYGITFDGNTRLLATKGQNLRLKNSTAAWVYAMDGGRAIVEDSTVSNTDAGNPPIGAGQGGGITLRGTNTLRGVNSAIWIDANAWVNLSSTTVNIGRTTNANTSAAVTIDAGGGFFVSSSSIVIGNQFWNAIASKGTIAATSMTMTFNATINDAISISNGGSITLSGGQMNGTSPVTGFVENGVGRMAGSGFVLKGSSQCWWSSTTTGLLSQSASSATGASTAVLSNVSVPSISSVTGAAVTAYADALNTNQLRTNMRNLNSSAWTCG